MSKNAKGPKGGKRVSYKLTALSMYCPRCGDGDHTAPFCPKNWFDGLSWAWIKHDFNCRSRH